MGRSGRGGLTARNVRQGDGGGFGRTAAVVLLILVVGAAAYHNAFLAPFVFDDDIHIVRNPALASFAAAVRGTPRPLTFLTFAANYRWGGLDVRGFHAVNIAIHLAVGVLLFLLLRRVLRLPVVASRLNGSAQGLAAAVALWWTAHPLQTESVTYTVQRSEALAGLFYLGTLWGFVQGRTSSGLRRGIGYAVAVGACLLGAASKEILVSAPIMILVWDWVLFGRGPIRALREDKGLFAGLASSWVVLAALMSAPSRFEVSAGLGYHEVTPAAYLRTQAGVLLHYLRLVVWPSGLCLDYGWPISESWRGVLLPGVFILAGLVATAVLVRRRSPWGLPGAWFFLILAPTSSFVPLADAAFEHRMYLPSASVILVVVFAMEGLLRRGIPDTGRRRWAFGALTAAVTVALGCLTMARNHDYRSRLAIWEDTAAKRPDNPRARYNLGNELAHTSPPRIAEATVQFEEALRLKPDYGEVHNNLGNCYAMQGDMARALAQYRLAVRAMPWEPETHYNLGRALHALGRLDEAEASYSRAIRLNPRHAKAYNNRGVVRQQRGDFDGALADYRAALRADPSLSDPKKNIERLEAAGLVKTGL